MQLNKEYDFKKRSQFIISKAYTSQPIAGADYSALKRCYLICITNFVLFSKSEQERIQYENELIFDLDIRSGLNRAMEGEIKGIKERKN